MNMSDRQIMERIRRGEGISTEFKASRERINRDVYETVCAFLNRKGGTILLGVLGPGGVCPFSKKSGLSAFFREIHRADELGSGMRRMMKYGKAYGGEDPQMVEGDVFRILVEIPEFDV